MKLWHGDCLELMKDIPDKSVDMILCDLPYGTTQNKWDSIIPLDKLWDHYIRICKEDSPILLFGQTPFDKVLGCSNIKMLRYEWVWEKTSSTGHLNANRTPMKSHENILVFYKNLPIYHPQKTTGHKRKVSTSEHKRNSKKTTNWGEHGLTSYDSTERYPRDVIVFPLDRQKSSVHPTQKPIDLLQYLIKTYSDEEDVVLDNTMGSGSTGVACVNTKRDFIGIEKDGKYFEIACDRITEAREKRKSNV